MSKTPKTHTEMVADRLAAMNAGGDARRLFDAAQRKNGNHLRDAVRKATDREVMKLLTPSVKAFAKLEIGAACAILEIAPPAPDADAVVTSETANAS